MKSTSVELAEIIDNLPIDERKIVEHLVKRLKRLEFDSPGKVPDYVQEYVQDSVPDSMPQYVDDEQEFQNEEFKDEGFKDVLEAFEICFAELLCMSRYTNEEECTRKTVYVCHPYSHNPKGNVARVRNICLTLVEEDVLPIAPHLSLPQFVDDETNREKALTMCCQLLAMCDEVQVYGPLITEGMQREIAHAFKRNVPVRFMGEYRHDMGELRA